MRKYICFIRTGILDGKWHSTHETPSFSIEAMDHGHAAHIVAHMPAHNPCATFHNMWVTDEETGACEVFTSRRGSDGSFCRVRPWNAATDLNLPEYTAAIRKVHS